MQLVYKDTEKLENGNMQDNFTTDHPKFGKVSFEYVGEEGDLDKFLKTLIIDYARSKNLID